MTSSPTETSTVRSPPPTLEELTRRTVRTLILPHVSRYVAREVPSPRRRGVIVIVNARTWSMTIVEGGVNLERFLRERRGPLPASKASIDAMPVMKVEEEGTECAICLAEFGVGGEAKEMPCKHKYHSACIEKWLRMHGSCPICRYNMPVEEKSTNKREAENDTVDDTGEAEAEAQHEEEGGNGRGTTFVFHVFNSSRRVRRRRSSETEADPDWNSSRGGVTGDENLGSSTQGIEIDSQPTVQNMDTEESTS